MIPARNQHNTHHEDTDQSGRSARHHRRARTRHGHGRRGSLRQVLQDLLFRLRQVRRRQVRFLLQVKQLSHGGGGCLKKACPRSARLPKIPIKSRQ